MQKLKFTLLVLLCAGFAVPSFCQTEGFYKDLFMDGGKNLTSRKTLPAAFSLNLSMEYLATEDIDQQYDIMIQNENDENGVLLYPDGAPRFRMIYTNGGSATNHGISLGEEGRDRVRQFYYNGGSYSGTCAGAFIASLSYMATGLYEPYYHIWPGRTELTTLSNTPTGHFITDGSPLLDYYDFGNDNYIANIAHNGGCFARENIDFPEGTEVLLRFDFPQLAMHQQPSCWAYKADESSGRLVVIGSHPEGEIAGEKLDLMKAILTYGMDGNAGPKIKGELTNGITRNMDKSTADEKPQYTKIGDRQYHHFIVNMPENARNLEINLIGDDRFDLNLYLKKDGFAFDGDSEYASIIPGATKSLYLSDVSDGHWYIGVKCVTTVNSRQEFGGYGYFGDLDVLNGVAYSINTQWDVVAQVPPSAIGLFQNYPNPFNAITNIEYHLLEEGFVDLSIYNHLGQKIDQLVSSFQPAGEYKIDWNADDVPNGVYFCRISLGGQHNKDIKLIVSK